MTDYDSSPDTLAHIGRVRELLAQVENELNHRGHVHDQSKLEPPELDTFNEYTPKLKASTYGSDEYKGYLDGMAGGLRHHYEHNRHHPEHFPNGIDDMTLVDLVEMLADWKAATERHDDGDMARSLGIQRSRFHISLQLARILENTVDALGWWSR
jgi:hypothetical protein